MVPVNCSTPCRKRSHRVTSSNSKTVRYAEELLLKNSELLMLGQYKQENARLRELLGSPLRRG